MRFTAKIIESDSKIRKDILDIIVAHMDGVLKKSVVPIEAKIRILIKEALRSQPEYDSLISPVGKLRLEFGIANTSDVDKIIDLIVGTSNFTIKPPKPSNLGVNGGFELTVLPADSLQAIARSVGHTSEKGVMLPWLDWLLYQGVSPIVRGYDVKITGNIYSRTGGALMVKSTKNWRVPGEFAGTVTNNWVTRAIDTIEKNVLSSIRRTIEDNI